MIRVDRHERGGLIRPANARRDSTGARRLTGALTRTGIFEYVYPDGKRVRELRDDNLVFRNLSEHWDNLPVVGPKHTMVTMQNAGDVVLGYVIPGTARRDGIWVVADFVIVDPDAAAMVLDGTYQELSGGYAVDVNEGASGVWNGQEYDAMQIPGSLVQNHVALCFGGTARAGSGARIK